MLMNSSVTPVAFTRITSGKVIIALGVIIILLWAPSLMYPAFLMKVMCFALFAGSFNLLVGYAGLLSLGHAMFFGGAAYISAYASKVLGFPPELAILSGVAFAALIGLITGFLAIRRHGIYFAMVTLALSQLVFFICLQIPASGGEDGLQNVPRGLLFGAFDLRSDWNLYFVVMVITLFGFAVIWRTVNSPFGQSLKAIRDNENRAISLGYRVERYKLGAFILSAALAGLAGATKAIIFQLASLTDVSWQMSGEVVLMTVMGGMGTLLGPVVGAALIVTMQNYMTELGDWVLVIQGCVFVAIVSFARRGLVGEIIVALQRKR